MARPRSLPVPTRRAAIALAAAAPLALVVAATAPGAWVVALLAGCALLLLVVVDAMLAARMDDVQLTVPADVEVGDEAKLSVLARFSSGHVRNAEIALQCDPRLAPGGRMTFPLKAGEQGAKEGDIAFRPGRRGTASIDRIWLRWNGPMGLGARQCTLPIDREIRIWPSVAAIRSPALQTFLRDAQFGLIARRIRGEGTQFESLAEYEPGMDRRRIDWKASARHVHLYAKEYETERNNPIVFAFDCGQSMCEPVDGMPRIDRAVSAALATAYVALKAGDRVSFFGFAARPELATPFVTASSEFHRLQRAAAGIEYRAEEPNFTLALATLAGRLQRRSLIVIFSDFTDPTSAELMIESIGRLMSRHLVLFVTLVDSELESMSLAEPDDMEALSMAVSADLLLRQRALVTRRLRQLGVEVIEARHDQFGTRLIDAYLAIKRAGAIG